MVRRQSSGFIRGAPSSASPRAVTLWFTLAAALASGGCPHRLPPVTPPPDVITAPIPEPVRWQESKTGLGFRLSDADPEPPARQRVEVTTLADEDTKALLARLPPMAKAPSVKRFALRERSLPAPRPGETVKTPFPPAVRPLAASAPVPADRPLVVERRSPEGLVPMVPELSVTFSEPMIELTSHAELEKTAPPVRLTPQPEGRWRWIGTQTVLFDPDGERFPMATDYRVTIPAGTRSAAGKPLPRAEEWTFSTPRAPVARIHPSPGAGPQRLEPILFASFDQRVDPAAVLAHTTLRPAGASADAPSIALRLAKDEELAADRELRALRQSAEPGRWLAFRAVEPLPRATRFELTFEAGLPSAEGPLRTERPQTFGLRTFDPLALQDVTCAWGGPCPPMAPWTVELNNPLDAGAFDRELVRVDPPLGQMKVDVSGSRLVIRGRSRGRTRYTVTLLPGLRDTFGQVLETAATGTVDVAAAEPILFPEQDAMVVTDPASPAQIAVFSVNRPALRVRLYRVTPEDYPAYLRYREAWDQDQRLVTPPGKLALDRVVQPRAAPDELVETLVDLGPALADGHGQVLAVVEPTTPPRRDPWGGVHREWVRCWVQATNLGLQAFWDQDTLHGWTSALTDGSPLGGVELSLVGVPGRSITDATGLARLALGAPSALLVARRDGDVAFLTTRESARWGSDGFAPSFPGSSERWFLFTDRGLYKPGERVHAKGWVRRLGAGRGGDVEALPAGTDRDVRYRVNDARGAELAKGSALLDDAGGFHLAFDLPKNANLGPASIVLSTRRDSWALSHPFRIDEFRRPEFEVAAAVGEGPHLVGGHTIATVTAAYYAGGGLPAADVRWTVTARDATYVPPNLGGFHFGKAPRFFSWWSPPERSEPEEWRARTGPDGAHRLRVDFDALAPYFPRSLDLEATVTDVNQQEWTARANVLVHPATVTVGLRTAARLVRAGEDIVLEALVSDLDGEPVDGRAVEVRAARREWEQVRGEYAEREVDPVTCTITSTNEPERCTLPTRAGGQHLLSAIVTDEHGRKSRSELRLWVLGDDVPEGPQVPAGKVELLPDREEYRGGDRARLLVMAPFAPAEGVLTVRRDGIEEVRRVTLRETTSVLEVSLLERYVPNVTARLALVGADLRKDERGRPDPSLPRRPAFARGEVTLRVPPADRTLAIAVEPAARTTEPGSKTRIAVGVTDATGRPVAGAQVALVVVDESVLALTGFKTPDPLEVFYPLRGEGTADLELRYRIALLQPDLARMQVRARASREARDGAVFDLGAPTANGGGHGPRLSKAKAALSEEAAATPRPVASPTPPATPASVAPPEAATPGRPGAAGKDTSRLAVRLDFDALAAFVPDLRTDARGRAAAKVKLPDSLTRYRVMAVAAAGRNRFGSAEDAIVARLPLMVRASPPRFLNFGDRIGLPVVLQNQTDEPLVVDVVARASNLELLGARGLRATVPANDRAEVLFPAAAARPGMARLQVGAASAAGDDASEHEFPVWTPATTEAFATYGSLAEGAISQPVRRPRDAVKEWGGLELTTSSTALQGLTDAVLYLVKYPYECNEQIASRVLTIAALRDVLGAFQAQGLPPQAALLASVKEDVKKLAERQHWSGGWDWWRRDREPSPFVSLHVAHALVRAEQKGFPVPEETLRRGLEYVRGIRWRIPAVYPQQVRQVLIAYGLYVQQLAQQPDRAAARQLVKDAGGMDRLPLEAVGLLWPVFTGQAEYQGEVAEIRRLVGNRVTETAGNAHFVTGYDDGAWLLLHSDRRVDGILLEAMIGDQPESSLVPKLVKGLLAARKRGAWYNTQENAFVLLALDRYFATYEKVTPDFVARAWLGDGLVAEHRFQGRTTERQHVEVPMDYLASLPQPSPLVLAKDGPGRLYYRLGMQYAPRDLELAASDHGFAVSRTYEAVEQPSDVRRDRDGAWHVKRGATVRVRVGLVARARRYHVALVDPLPAGFEPLNPELATTATIPDAPDPAAKGAPWWWSSAWYEHQNLRDERAEAFTSLLWEGVYEYVYAARATTPGRFVVPPPKAEEMYDPETFGRGASDRVVVE